MRAKLTITVLLALPFLGGGAQAHAAAEPTRVSGEWAISAVWINETGNRCPRPNELASEGICRVFSTITRKGATVFTYPRCCYSEAPVSLVQGADGNIWLADAMNDSIERYQPSGGLMYYHVIGAPVEIIVGPDGALWFADVWPSIGRITTSGELTEYPLPPMTGPTKLRVENGAIYFDEQWANATARITTSGQIQQFPNPPARVTRHRRSRMSNKKHRRTSAYRRPRPVASAPSQRALRDAIDRVKRSERAHREAREALGHEPKPERP